MLEFDSLHRRAGLHFILSIAYSTEHVWTLRATCIAGRTCLSCPLWAGIAVAHLQVVVRSSGRLFDMAGACANSDAVQPMHWCGLCDAAGGDLVKPACWIMQSTL
eukprot:357218-Chlamydomonas_euryale.AAC.21